MWLLIQGFRYRPVSRSVFPERLPDDNTLPALDIFIMTADPDKEPTIEVMNTVLSVMAIDYPSEKLHIYLSDDAGADVTLCASKEAYSLARYWVPFCKRFGIAVRCPEVFFNDSKIDQQDSDKEFSQERQKIKVMYDTFKEKIKKLKENKYSCATRFQKTRQEHPSQIEIIREEESNSTDKEDFTIPSLVYVSREKRIGVQHRFKAGALNVLLRVSGVITNSPYILVLDCDMYSNDPSSARQAMCFHLDSKLSPSLAFVQFPQEFYNISKNDIYCAEIRQIFKTFWLGLDGLRGPVLSGTNYFVKRCTLYGARPGGTSNSEEKEISRLKHKFGNSNEFCLSLVEKSSHYFDEKITTYVNPQKENILTLASCDYENGTQWGERIGYLYGSVVEDYFTGFHLHCRGWVSTYCFPSKPAFLGNICFLNGISLFPEVTSPWFGAFVVVFLSSCIQHLREVFRSGRNLTTWCNEQRFWMMIGLTGQLFAIIDVFLKLVGISAVNFDLTNKTADKTQIKRYENGVFDFEGCSLMLLPATTLSLLNLGALIGGAWQMITQFIFSCFILALSLPLIEGIVFRQDSGRVPPRVAFWSLVLSGSIILFMFIFC
ncbi:Cellulose synthase-like protein [Rhynchospora pubera]|uniref:Cellulose synthase-like protein n=1 Tax=Rhynchospora pubera TaxID=906938 RepID=A0AAV8HBM1_9POAL|nr:Cellulose synthase-like protein [Rhynchospora pubera]